MNAISVIFTRLSYSDEALCCFLINKTGSYDKTQSLIDAYGKYELKMGDMSAKNIIFNCFEVLNYKGFHQKQQCYNESDIIAKERIFIVLAYMELTNNEIVEVLYDNILCDVDISCTEYLEKVNDYFKTKKVDILGNIIAKLVDIDCKNDRILKLMDGLDMNAIETDSHQDKRRNNSSKACRKKASANIKTERCRRYIENKFKYPIRSDSRNYCLVLNDKSRNGSNVDERTLEQTFNEFPNFELVNIEFSINLLNDLNKVIKELDFSNSDCVICCIMCHGNYDLINIPKGPKIHINQIILLFNSYNIPYLKSKPKILWIQACRGPSLNPTDNYLPDHHSDQSNVDTNTNAQSYGQPIHVNQGDYYIIMATMMNHLAIRDELKGSHFIYYFCELLRKHKKSSLQEICKLYNQEPPKFINKEMEYVQYLEHIGADRYEICLS